MRRARLSSVGSLMGGGVCGVAVAVVVAMVVVLLLVSTKEFHHIDIHDAVLRAICPCPRRCRCRVSERSVCSLGRGHAR